MSACEPWPILWPCDKAPTAEPAIIDAAIRSAEALLWAHTGRNLGRCTTTEHYRPAASSVCGTPYKDEAGFWHNGGRGGSCCVIHLEQLPVAEVLEVRVWGVVVPPAGYRLGKRGRLVRLGVCWPVGVDCDEPPVQVTYRHGHAIGDGSRLHAPVALAMGEVATEYVEAGCGRMCKLPSRALSITRANVTTSYPSPQELLDAGRLGLPLADRLIEITNPTGRRYGRSKVFSPDRARRV